MGQIFYASVILLPLGISLRMSLRLLYGARGPQVGDPIHQIMSVLSWILTLTPLAILVVVSTSFLSLLILMIAGLAVLELVLARRELQRRSAWSLLNGEQANRTPSIDSLRCHQYRFSGMVGRAFRRLVNSLDRGVNVLSAIGQHHRALPREAQAYAAIDVVGKSIIKKHTEFAGWTENVFTQKLYQRLTYLAVVVMIMVGILTFVMIKIVPSYHSIFEDFDLELPIMTIYLISIADSSLSRGFVGLLSLCIFGFLLIGVVIFFLYLCDIAALRPLADRVFFAKHRALVLRLLSIGIQEGKPLELLLKQLAHGDQLYPSRLVRERLAGALRSINSGEDWKDALRKASFVKANDVPVLETAQQVGNLPWVLSMLANQKVRSMIFRWSAAEQIIFPLAVLVLGFVVMFICVSLFIPLVSLINGLVG